MSIITDPEFKALIPPLTDDEFRQLEENIVRDGIRDPLVTWVQTDGSEILIDGHNRWAISAKHGGMSFQTTHINFADRDEAILWIIDNQLGRRNLSAYDRSVLALRMKPLIAEKAKQQQASHSDQGYQKTDKPVHTSKQLATIAGVSHDTIHKVEVIQDSADPHLIDSVRSGDTSINQAYNAVMVKKAEAEGRIPQTQAQKKRQEVVAAYERHEAYGQSGIASIADARQDREDRKTIALEWYGRIKNALKDLYWTGALNKTEVFAEMRKALTDEDRKKLIERIQDARMVLNVALSELGD